MEFRHWTDRGQFVMAVDVPNQHAVRLTAELFVGIQVILPRFMVVQDDRSTQIYYEFTSDVSLPAGRRLFQERLAEMTSTALQVVDARTGRYDARHMSTALRLHHRGGWACSYRINEQTMVWLRDHLPPRTQARLLRRQPGKPRVIQIDYLGSPDRETALELARPVTAAVNYALDHTAS